MNSVHQNLDIHQNLVPGQLYQLQPSGAYSSHVRSTVLAGIFCCGLSDLQYFEDENLDVEGLSPKSKVYPQGTIVMFLGRYTRPDQHGHNNCGRRNGWPKGHRPEALVLIGDKIYLVFESCLTSSLS
jgi:hypothetical protein